MKFKPGHFYHFASDPSGMLRNLTDEELIHALDIRPSQLAKAKSRLLLLADKGHLVPSVGCDNFDPVEGCLGHPIEPHLGHPVGEGNP